MQWARLVSELIQTHQPEEILDLKARKGYFSILAASYGAHVDVVDDVTNNGEYPDYLKVHPNITFFDAKVEDFKFKKKYDLIIIDISMPKMDGFEASERIIEHDKDALIVAISADNNPELIEKSELVGIKEFLPKPVRIEDLKKVFAKYF